MYAREVEGTRLNFAVSGKLWKRSLIMIDEETQTLWSQLLGKAMEGELKGNLLTILPSSLTSWKRWKQSHPDTTVIKLRRTSKSFRKDYYSKPERFVVGVNRQSISKAWPFDVLMKKRLVNDTFNGDSVVVHLDAETGAAHVYNSVLDGEKLNFEIVDGQVRDAETGTIWDLSTGKAKTQSGKFAGKSLQALPAIPSYRKSWENFFPNSEYYEGSNTEK